MPRLTTSQKAFVVERLACFLGPAEVRKQLLEEHRVDAPINQIVAYDPGTVGGQRLSFELKKLFEVTRAQFIANTSSIAIAHRSYRLRELDRMYRAAKNPMLALRILEQAAKEMGEMFTNRREITGKDGGALALDLFAGWSDEELEEFARTGKRPGRTCG